MSMTPGPKSRAGEYVLSGTLNKNFKIPIAWFPGMISHLKKSQLFLSGVLLADGQNEQK